MVDQLSWSAIGEWLAGFVPEGPARTAVVVVEGLCAALAPFIYKYYLGVLAQGAAEKGSLERQDYDKLRASLEGGNLAARLYAKWLTAFLDGIERFFGDAWMADRTLFPRAFGLQKLAPLWTAPAFDRCLLLALLYPIATIFFIWAVSGHVGPAEAALNLKPDLPGWQRGSAAAGIGFFYFAIWRAHLAAGWKHMGWRFAFATASTVALGVATKVVAGKAVPEYKRQLTAIGLTGQMFAGAFLGIAAQGLLAWGLIFHVMPWIGLDLLDMARAVAAFDLPMRIGQFFAGTL